MNSKIKVWAKIMKITKKIWWCHQLPERSFFICKYQFPLCARCTGVLAGYIIAFLLLCFGIYIPMALCLVFLLPLVLDGGIQLIFNIMSNNIRRFLTGVIFGIGFIQIFTNAFIFF